MSFRFRRSVTIIPGVRLNFGKSGISTSVGTRGANITLGPRGIYGNVGIPGTGVSYRTRLDPASSGRRGHTEYRALLGHLQAQEREHARLAASEQHAAHEAWIERFRGILADRVREPFDWEAVTASLGPYTPQLFVPPPAASPLFWARLIPGQQQKLLARQAEAGEHALRLHEEAERERAAEWERIATDRRRLRNTVEQGDPEPLVELLASELANEDLPIPLLFELEFEGVREVRIELVLPELEAVPEERTALTKTGRLSRRKLAQRDRVAIYRDLCCGLALRLAYETFRVLPMVERITVVGLAEQTDPATGHPSEFAALTLSTIRSAFTALNLAGVEPQAALEGLGGRFGCNARGELQRVR